MPEYMVAPRITMPSLSLRSPTTRPRSRRCNINGFISVFGPQQCQEEGCSFYKRCIKTAFQFFKKITKLERNSLSTREFSKGAL